MRRNRSLASFPGLGLILVVLVGACSAGTSDGPSSLAPASSETTPSPATVAAEPWRTAELRDVRTGETFSVNELAGSVVVLELMAVWCINCRIQQDEARTALASLAADEVVYISVDVDPNETDADLARYADELDYPWHFVVASRDVARSLAESFGDQVLSPPSTPHIVVTADGRAEVSFGFKSAPDLEARLAALLP